MRCLSDRRRDGERAEHHARTDDVRGREVQVITPWRTMRWRRTSLPTSWEKPASRFRLLYGFLILRHSRRELLWLGVTAHPSAEWIAR
jgi:hypothetical protein